MLYKKLKIRAPHSEQGKVWTSIPLPEAKPATLISSSPTHHYVLCLTASGEVYRRTSVTSTNAAGTEWTM